jgi:hypothetical protein
MQSVNQKTLQDSGQVSRDAGVTYVTIMSQFVTFLVVHNIDNA